MLEFYVNYAFGSEKDGRRMQVGPFKTAAIAEANRQKILKNPNIFYCFLGVSRDQTRHLVREPDAHQFELTPA